MMSPSEAGGATAMWISMGDRFSTDRVGIGEVQRCDATAHCRLDPMFLQIKIIEKLFKDI